MSGHAPSVRPACDECGGTDETLYDCGAGRNICRPCLDEMDPSEARALSPDFYDWDAAFDAMRDAEIMGREHNVS